MEPNELSDHSSDDQIPPPLPTTPYLLFYSDVLKELSSTKDAVDIAKEAQARWSKMTPKSLRPYVEAALLMKSSLEVKPSVKKLENEIEIFGKSLKTTKSSREICKLRKQTQPKLLDDMLSKKGKKTRFAKSKRVTFDKTPNNKNKTVHGVAKSKAMKCKTKEVKSKCCRKKYCCSKKKPKKKKVSKCKQPCLCKKLKGDCHFHNKKGQTENLINRQLQDYLRYKSKRKRKLKRGLEDFLI